MADIINLNKARKAKTKQADKKKAAENRVAFGTSTKLKQLEKAKQAIELARLEAQKLEPQIAKPMTGAGGLEDK